MFDVARSSCRNSNERDPSLSTYVESTLRKLRVPSLHSLHTSFIQDKGELLAISRMSALETLAAVSIGSSKSWFFVEESEPNRLRAWQFQSFLGVSAQFCSKLLLQERGAIGVHQFSAHSGVPEIARFQGVGRYGRCSLLMAPADYFSK